MTKKTVAFKIPPKAVDQAAEAWVATRDAAQPALTPEHSATVTQLPRPAEPMKRFTIDVTEELHKRIKMQCASRGVKMADVIRELLETEFPSGQGA